MFQYELDILWMTFKSIPPVSRHPSQQTRITHQEKYVGIKTKHGILPELDTEVLLYLFEQASLITESGFATLNSNSVHRSL